MPASSPPTSPTSEFTVICPREDEHEYSVDHRNGQWFIRTNDRAATSASSPRPSMRPRAKTGSSASPIATPSCSKMSTSSPLLRRLRTRRRPAAPAPLALRQDETAEANPAGEIAFPEPAYSASPGINRIFETTALPLRLSVAGHAQFGLRIRPRTARIQRSSSSRKSPAASIAPSTPASASTPPQPTASRFPSRSSIAKTSSREPGKIPLYVYGYGSYGYSLPLGFNSNRLSLLDRGVVMAYAHIRGGGDLGKPWHDAGKMLRQAQHLHRLHRRRRAPHRRPATAIPAASPSKAARPAAC